MNSNATAHDYVEIIKECQIPENVRQQLEQYSVTDQKVLSGLVHYKGPTVFQGKGTRAIIPVEQEFAIFLCYCMRSFYLESGRHYRMNIVKIVLENESKLLVWLLEPYDTPMDRLVDIFELGTELSDFVEDSEVRDVLLDKTNVNVKERVVNL